MTKGKNYTTKISLLLNNNDVNYVLKKLKKYETNLIKAKKEINENLNLLNTIRTNIVNKHYGIREQINKCKEVTIEYKPSVNITNITNKDEYENRFYTKFPIITVSENELPYINNSPIYKIKETNEYCIKINDKIIRGNIGNIYKDNNCEKINECTKEFCNGQYYNKPCKFLHEGEVRNYPNYSWVYNMKCSKLNLQNTRMVGSLENLGNDIINTNIYEKKLRNNQLMHDILIYQIIDKYLDHYDIN